MSISNPRERAAAALRILKLVFWKDEKDLADQLVRWRGPRMARLVARLVELHRELLSNSSAGETMLAQALAGIARQAAR